MGWNYLSIPKLQRLHRWSLGMDKSFHPTHYQACNYLSMLGLKINRVSKRRHRRQFAYRMSYHTKEYMTREIKQEQQIGLFARDTTGHVVFSHHSHLIVISAPSLQLALAVHRIVNCQVSVNGVCGNTDLSSSDEMMITQISGGIHLRNCRFSHFSWGTGACHLRFTKQLTLISIYNWTKYQPMREDVTHDETSFFIGCNLAQPQTENGSMLLST